METFALFDDKSSSKILYDFHCVGKNEVHRVQIKCLFQDRDVCRSAERGVWSALGLFESFFRPTGEDYFFLCEFADDEANDKASGQSAGLAFSLKFAHELYYKITNKKLNFSVAASGVLSDSTGDAKVNKVDKINEKLEAAYLKLTSGDKIFFPAHNEDQVRKSIKTKIMNKGIILCPVKTVEQAIGLLFGISTPHTPKINRKTKISFIRLIRPVLLITLILAILLVYIFKNQSNCYDRIIHSLEYGNFYKAKNKIELCLKKAKNDVQINRFKELQYKLNSDLNSAIDFEYFIKFSNLDTRQKQLQDISLSVHDGYRFKVLPEKNCYLYLLQFDSEKGVELLFPLTSFSVENHYILGKKMYTIPGGGNYFFLSDSTHQGLITLYFIASFWRARDIEELFQKYERAKVGEKHKYREKLIERIQKRSEEYDMDVKSIFYRKEFFLQE